MGGGILKCELEHGAKERLWEEFLNVSLSMAPRYFLFFGLFEPYDSCKMNPF